MVKKLLRCHREKLLYLVVGAWNTLFQYAVFSLLYWLLSAHLASPVIVLISYLFGSLNGFLGFKLIVFRSRQHPLKEYLRFQLVYGPLLVLNMVVLPLALEYSTLNAYVIQALFAVFAVVAGYLGNKHFAFRQPRPPADGVEGRRADAGG